MGVTIYIYTYHISKWYFLEVNIMINQLPGIGIRPGQPEGFAKSFMISETNYARLLLGKNV